MLDKENEKKCPKCGEDMKEYINKYWCRNRYKCGHIIKKDIDSYKETKKAALKCDLTGCELNGNGYCCSTNDIKCDKIPYQFYLDAQAEDTK